MREPWIEITVESFAEFKINELWPDGDAPNPITEADVRALIAKENPRRLTDEWFFPTPDIHVTLIDPRSAIGRVKEITAVIDSVEAS
jgi:hypothetical protein